MRVVVAVFLLFAAVAADRDVSAEEA